MANQPQVNQTARSWNPNQSFSHAERERWVCVYPAYINSKKTVKEGRRIPKDKAKKLFRSVYHRVASTPELATNFIDYKQMAGMTTAVDNPTYTEIRDVCLSAGFVTGVENKTYPRELDHRDLKYRGRIRVQIKNEDGSPKYENYPTRQALYLYLGDMIPKLKSRQSGGGGSQSSTQQQQGSKSQKKKDRKGRK